MATFGLDNVKSLHIFSRSDHNYFKKSPTLVSLKFQCFHFLACCILSITDYVPWQRGIKNKIPRMNWSVGGNVDVHIFIGR